MSEVCDEELEQLAATLAADLQREMAETERRLTQTMQLHQVR